MKKETIEEAAGRYVKHFAPSVKSAREIGFIDGANYQAERSYSEEEILAILHNYRNHFELYRNLQVLPDMFFGWFEQFKKK